MDLEIHLPVFMKAGYLNNAVIDYQVISYVNTLPKNGRKTRYFAKQLDFIRKAIKKATRLSGFNFLYLVRIILRFPSLFYRFRQVSQPRVFRSRA
jgi:hypothetical protein